MGGLSTLVDVYALNGAMSNLGTVTGRHEAGCASGTDVALAGLNLAGNLALNAIPGGEEARAVGSGRAFSCQCCRGCYFKLRQE